MKILLLLITSLCLAMTTKAGTFTSLSGGSWTNPATWTAVGDADGIPDSDDDVTIQATHNVTVSGTGHNCRDLVVDGILSLNSGCNVSVFGNYTLNGAEQGNNGSLSFKGSSKVISGAGSFGNKIRYSWVAATYTIAADVTMLKSVVCSAGNGTLTNNGYIRFARIYGNNETFINNSGATLEFGDFDIASWNVNLNTSSSNNTVYYSNSSGTTTIKTPSNGSYANFMVGGLGSSKKLPADLHVREDFTIQSNGIIDSDGFDIYIGGDFTKISASGVITQDPGTEIILNGTSTQTWNTAGNLFINDFIFDNPTDITFETGSTYVFNSLTMNQGTVDFGSDNVILNSDANSTAYIGQSNGTFAGNLLIRRFIDSRPDGFSDMSSPLANGTFAELDDDMSMSFAAYVEDVSAPSAWAYDESLWDYVAIENSSDAMEPGVGYEVYLASDGNGITPFAASTIDFSGTPNIGDIEFEISYDNDGWNLLGNPYASFIDWESLYNDNSDKIFDEYYYYDEAIEDYEIGGIGDEFACGQGFWVEAFDLGTITFQESYKTTSTNSDFRRAKKEKFGLRISSTLVKNTTSTYFRFNENASWAYEGNHDMTFLKLPAKDAPQMYTHSLEGKKLKMNEIVGENVLAIPVSFKAGVDGIYSVKSVGLSLAFDEGYDYVVIEDMKNGQFYDLSIGDYEFYATTFDDEERFILHLRKSDELTTNSDEVTFINSTEGVFVNFELENSSKALIGVYNLAGQEIAASQNLTVDHNRVKILLPNDYSGVYLIRVIVGDKVKTQRFFK